MRQNGAMFICNRCRKQVFAERFDDGRFDQKALDGWALETRDFFGVGDLCPECFKVYRETMERFIREANVEPENTCCTCYYHDAKSWFCYNGLSPKGTENTDPEDTCEFYEKRSECES